MVKFMVDKLEEVSGRGRGQGGAAGEAGRGGGAREGAPAAAAAVPQRQQQRYPPPPPLSTSAPPPNLSPPPITPPCLPSRPPLKPAASRHPSLPSPPSPPRQAGCSVGAGFIKAERCDAEVGGGFRPPHGVRRRSPPPLLPPLLPAQPPALPCAWAGGRAKEGEGAGRGRCLSAAVFRSSLLLQPPPHPPLLHPRPRPPPLPSIIITDQVVICHNHLSSQQEVTHALTHELIHAYDHCRASSLDWANCEHHACSEIRAASLSGEGRGRRVRGRVELVCVG